MSKKKIPRKQRSAPSVQSFSTSQKAPYSQLVVRVLEAGIDRLRRHSALYESILVCIIIVVGVLIRLEDLRAWNTYKTTTFFDGAPLHTTFDAYFYLSLAQDVIEGTYAPVDEKRGVPDCPPRPSPAPLLSVLAACIVRATSWSLSWVGAVLPTLLGPLFVIPLYLFGRTIAGPLCGLAASLFSVLYPFYVYRSNLGRFDTDCLNITFAVSIAYLFLKFGTSAARARYIYFGAAGIVYLLFLWWWDQSPAAVSAITILPCVTAIALFYRPTRREAAVFACMVSLCVLGFITLKGFDAVAHLVKRLISEYLYIAKAPAGDFPNIGLSISEQTRPSFDAVIAYTSVNTLAFLLSVAGCVMMIWQRPRHTLMLLSLIVLSILAFTYANRFLLFFVPLVALGAGYVLWFLWIMRRRFTALYGIVPLVCCVMTWSLVTANLSSVQWPKEPASIVAGMNAAKQQTPPDAVIWAWWDHGYALTYFARRATVNDGSLHGGERTVYTAIPLATDNARYAANFMHFYVKRGIPGIQRLCTAAGGRRAGMELMYAVLSAGPEEGLKILQKTHLTPSGAEKTPADWLSFFFPRERRPVYLFLDSLLPKIAYWWYWFGTWDCERRDGIHPLFSWFSPITVTGNTIAGPEGLELNLNTGELQLAGRRFPLSTVVIRDPQNLREKNYSHNSQYRFELFEQGKFGALMEHAVAESVFNRLYIRHTFDQRYFKPVALAAPAYQLWEVIGDALPGPAP
ncbi:MAG: dolichyl-diphosphooligosaccharide--protein glycosyltransferase subunit STT3 [Desulfobacterota bacterium]|nr:dolichyl-diphosphooligosaccharide--protein glycosyltransferase subunit STT3 [Thermodesulfobacteriota bacterium]